MNSVFLSAARTSGFQTGNVIPMGFRSESARLNRLVARTREIAPTLQEADDSTLARGTDLLRRHGDAVREHEDLLAHAAATIVEAVRRTRQVELYDTQLRAGLAMCFGRIAEMQTGEGKTFAGMIPTYVFAIEGRGTHVCLPNDYLAARDWQTLSPVIARVGMSSALRKQNDCVRVSRLAYDADVTYGPGQLFGFDHLRDQWEKRRFLSAPIGTTTIDRLMGRGVDSRLRMRGLHSAVIDEADQVLVDDATTPLLVNRFENGPAPDTELHHQARSVALTLSEENDFRIDVASGAIHLTEQGFRRVYSDEDLATNRELRRPWHDYVLSALRANYTFARNKHYVVVNGEIRLVEGSTGRVFRDRTWTDGLHQAIQVKERLKVTAESESQGRITRQSFFRLYQHLCGMTGTATACRSELRSVYGLGVTAIDTLWPSDRQMLPSRVCPDVARKLSFVCDEARAMIDQGRCVLIGTSHIGQTQTIAKALRAANLAPQVLSGVQDSDEAEIISHAGKSGAVTVATHLAGRGTDIALEASAAAAGGLHVIAWEHHRTARVDRQLIGRSARQGDPGSARFYVSPDDHFISKHAPYLAASVVRCLDQEFADNALRNGIRIAQRRVEAADRRERAQLFREEQHTNEVISSLHDKADATSTFARRRR